MGNTKYSIVPTDEAHSLCFERNPNQWVGFRAADLSRVERGLVALGMLPASGLRKSGFASSMLGGRSAYVISPNTDLDPLDISFPITWSRSMMSRMFLSIPGDRPLTLVWRDRSRVEFEHTNLNVLKVFVRSLPDDYFLAFVCEWDREKSRAITDYYLCDQVPGVLGLMSDLGRLYPDLAQDYNLP